MKVQFLTRPQETNLGQALGEEIGKKQRQPRDGQPHRRFAQVHAGGNEHCSKPGQRQNYGDSASLANESEFGAAPITYYSWVRET